MKKKYYQMQEAVEILREEYPDINASTLRFWEKVRLIRPSQITSGGHRRYSEEDLDLIRFIKNLSSFGYSIQDIRREIHSVKEKISSGKPEEVKSGLFSTQYVAKLFLHHRTRVSLAKKIAAYYDLDENARYLATFEKEVLAKRLEYHNPTFLIEEAEKLKLIKPYKKEKRYLYSPYDELILNILIFILQVEKDFINRCKNFADAVYYLYKEVGLNARFPVKPEVSFEVKPVKAFLYNIIQERIAYEERKK